MQTPYPQQSSSTMSKKQGVFSGWKIIEQASALSGATKKLSKDIES